MLRSLTRTSSMKNVSFPHTIVYFTIKKFSKRNSQTEQLRLSFTQCSFIHNLHIETQPSKDIPKYFYPYSNIQTSISSIGTRICKEILTQTQRDQYPTRNRIVS